MSWAERQVLTCLESWESGPLDLHLSRYFRKGRIGKRDRALIGEAIWQLVRWQGLLDALGASGWKGRLEVLKKTDVNGKFDLPDYQRVSFPKKIFDRLVGHYGREQAIELCQVLNSRAPTTVRVNLLKTTRGNLLGQWEGARPCEHSAAGITFDERVSLLKLPEYEAGLFELQDEGSQLVADQVEIEPGQRLLDYCAGSGGKSMAIAPRMGGKGQIFLHDVRSLVGAKKRLKRAGIQNAQFVPAGDKRLKNLKVDWVLVDAPCSGSGTYRRSPEARYRPLDLEHYVDLQRQIVGEASQYLSPGGRLVYATCSIFPEENQQQLAYFKDQFRLVPTKEPFFSLPEKGKMDGFFAVVLQMR